MFTLITLVAALAVDFLISAGVVWCICALLNALGVYAIGSFAVVFSWKLAMLIWLIIGLLHSIFRGSSKSSD